MIEESSNYWQRLTTSMHAKPAFNAKFYVNKVSGIAVELMATPFPVTEGGSLTLTCSVTENSSVYASFSYENGSTYRFVQLVEGQCKDGTGQVCDQQCSCTTDGTSFSIIITSVDRSWDKARVRCQVNNPVFTNSDIIEIRVLYPPTGTLMVTPSGTQSIFTGTSVTLQCQVRGGNPLATLTWQCKGSSVTGQDLTNATTAVSTLTFTADRTYHQQQCVCTAVHPTSPSGVFDTVSIIFNVLYSPDRATFSIVFTTPFYVGDDVYLDCMIDGGNPLATLSWICVNQLKETSTNMDTETKAVSRLGITSVTTDYNNRQCTCTATHIGFSPSLTKVVLITVYYPPSLPVLAVDTTNGGRLPWMDRPLFTGILTCTASPGNPPTTRISWYINDVIDTSQSAITRRFDPPDKLYNGHTFTCRADNNFTDTKGTNTVSNGIMLNIEYDPIVTVDVSTAYINESLGFSRTCSADGNPTPIVSWYRDTILVQSQGTLQLSKIDRQDAGTYLCTATARSTNNNILLQSSESFTIVVQYGPDVGLAIKNTTENMTDVRLNCTANGVPAQYTYRWIHKVGYTVIRDTFDHVTSSGSVSTLTIPQVSYQDMGTYICEAENGYRGRDGQIVQTEQGVMTITGSPRVFGNQNRYEAETNIAFDANITYISFPAPVNTSILRPDSVLPPSNELSVTVSSVSVTVSFYNKGVSVDAYSVHLHFSNFQSKYSGKYQLYVRNVFTYYYNFEIVIAGKPDSPVQLVISEITQSQAVVSWRPGNENENSKTFTLTYQKLNSDSTTYVTLDREITSYTIEQLLPATQYDVSVFAINAYGSSEAISGTFITAGLLPEYSNTGVILISVGSVMILMSLSVLAVALFTLRKRRLPFTKQTSSKKKSVYHADVAAEPGEIDLSQYEDLNLEQVDSPTVYEEMPNKSTDTQGNPAYEESNTYEQLQRNRETNPYEAIPQRQQSE
ncbi:synaptogenesis protein syg-2-like [Ylistrum balloti]|uniref:synaptogenesis protein syg-2-like n=1 Tax=Ylistrum balloti TaxID=509963 RepID=UPI0029059FF4|nr:synaptogenesis protein syg-2-like [Ylistrum balloti]